MMSESVGVPEPQKAVQEARPALAAIHEREMYMNTSLRNIDAMLTHFAQQLGVPLPDQPNCKDSEPDSPAVLPSIERVQHRNREVLATIIEHIRKIEQFTLGVSKLGDSSG